MASKEIQIGNHVISEGEAPFFIAEIGINHNGDINLAKRLIDASYAIGWDCVKFQKRTPDIAVQEQQKTVMRDTPWGRMTYLEYKKRIEFERPEYDVIDAYCKDKPIIWTASPWDKPSLEFLLDYDVPFIKVASALNGNEELLGAICKSGKPIIMSTGMCTEKELDRSVEFLEKNSNGDYILLHTNSTYPADESKLNLSYMEFMKKRYGCLVGYSGHERSIDPTVSAIMMGAKVIERHVTLSRDMWGTDQGASLEIPDMFELYKRAEGIENILGNELKVLDEEELKVRKKLRVE